MKDIFRIQHTPLQATIPGFLKDRATKKTVHTLLINNNKKKQPAESSIENTRISSPRVKIKSDRFTIWGVEKCFYSGIIRREQLEKTTNKSNNWNE